MTLLGRALEKSDWRLLAYALMSNHIHMMLVAGMQRLDRWIRRVHAPFADAMNRAHDRIGCMFVRGPKALYTRSEEVGSVIAYIHNNPVRGGVCVTAATTDWTSHRAYLGLMRAPAWLHVAEGLSRAGFTNAQAFDAWVNDPARVDDDASYAADIEGVEARAALEAQRAAQASAKEATAQAIVEATADVLEIALPQLQSASRRDAHVRARAVAVHAAMALGVSGRAVANALQLSQQRVSLLRRQSLSPDVRSLAVEVARRVEKVAS